LFCWRGGNDDMSCNYGNCNDANCVAGADSDVNGNPCDDQSCPPCGSSLPAGTTVVANPGIPAQSSAASASSLSALGSTMGQWGATIASIATGTPAVITNKGATVSNTTVATTSNMSMILLLVVGLVVVLLVMEKK